jgi:hypothetical protein
MDCSHVIGLPTPALTEPKKGLKNDARFGRTGDARAASRGQTPRGRQQLAKAMPLVLLTWVVGCNPTGLSRPVRAAGERLMGRSAGGP